MKTVCNKNHGNAFGSHAADGIQQCLCLFFRQDSRRLIQYQQFQIILAELSRDLSKLLMTHGHIADNHFGVNLNAHLINSLLRTFGHLLIIKGI